HCCGRRRPRQRGGRATDEPAASDEDAAGAGLGEDADVSGSSAGDVSIEARVRQEVERAIQRNIKGLQYLTSSDPSMGATPKDVIYRRGTLELYHYRPVAQEVYRVPVLIVMSLVSRSYIL